MAVTTVSSLAEMYTSAPLSVDGLGKAASDSPAIELLEKGNGSPENEVEQASLHAFSDCFASVSYHLV